MIIKFRHQNDGKQKEASDQAVAPYDPVSLTVQAHAEDADINVLMRRYGITGKFPENPRVPSYGDFSEITDFRSALNAVRQGHEAFMEYPAEFRARFDNDPQLFLEWTADQANRPEMQKLGMLKELQQQPAVQTAPAAPNAGNGSREQKP